VHKNIFLEVMSDKRDAGVGSQDLGGAAAPPHLEIKESSLIKLNQGCFQTRFEGCPPSS
jgi:hypothetical protein